MPPCNNCGILVNLLFLYCFYVPHEKLPESICSQVAQLLKKERQKRVLSLNVLSRRAGLSRQSLSYIEQEKRIPSLYTLLRITAVLEVDLEKIIARARKQAVAQTK